jgi:hypothetical protein
MKIWWSRFISNQKLWEMTGQINDNMEIKRNFGWTGRTLCKDDSLARQLCNGIHRVQKEGEGKEIHGDELH